MKRTRIIAALVALLSLLIGWRVLTQPNKAQTPPPITGQNLVTPNTVRLSGANIYEAATAVTQTTYGATHHEDRPRAVTLVRADRQADAMLAASRITHFPVNSPVLYVDAERLPDETFNELKRLGPGGNVYDSNVQIYLVGEISPKVEQEIKDRLGYKTRAFRIDDPIALSEELDTWAADVHADHPDEAIIVQYDQLNTGLPAVAWNAHMGHGLFFVQGDTIPDATGRALSRRFKGEAFIYLFGDESLISNNIARQLAEYGHVQRIPGRDAFEISLNFAGYRDSGFNQGYWINWWARDFGWDVGEAGHNFTFVNADDWQQAVTGSVLSHMGKHGPMILVNQNGVNERTAEYLEKIRPSRTAANDQLNNHGWILGDTSKIGWTAQADIDLLLNQKEESR